ncbi:MAG: hypothetical protein IT389_07310 [Nitrospira sp.]|nr:hypothetical protein [Nitrospira sp.]
MSIQADFFSTVVCPHPKEIFEALVGKTNPQGGQIWAIRTELCPADLYCYLSARFGPPNGAQNFFRANDSDNLIHWDWTLSCEFGWITFLGMNFRTEIQLLGKFPFTEQDKEEFISQIKADFSNFGQKMSDIRSNLLEKWVEFTNPYQRLRRSIDQLLKELRSLELDPGNEKISDWSDSTNIQVAQGQWDSVAARYSKGLGLCFGVRSMLPVMAEAFVNVVLITLMKPEISGDRRLRENAFRQPIDIRIKSLHLNCNGFASSIDYSHETCRTYHSLVNERNDLLHGNVAIDKLRFNEVYFHGSVPVFNEYRSMWERSIGVEIQAVGFDKLFEEVRVIERFIEYVLDCLQPSIKKEIERASRKRDLGFNEKTGRFGILFPDHLVDMVAVKAPLRDLKDHNA